MKVFRIAAMVFLVLGCVPDQKNADDQTEYITTQIGEQRFRIPKYYLKSPHPTAVDDSAGVLVMYPDYKPPTEQPLELWKQGEWYRNVSVTFRNTDQTNSIQSGIDWSIQFYNATGTPEEQYGLIYRTFPEDSKIR